MKYAMLIGDGMADWPIAALDNKTPLEYAHTPNMDRVAATGTVGMVSTVPDGMPPGSDVANLSLLGYDPRSYYSGRAPIEAASMGIKLTSEDTAFRCNLVTILSETMVDYSAGHISTDEAHRIIGELKPVLEKAGVSLYPGVSYRHLLVYRGFGGNITTTPPHDITGKPIVSYLPQGADAPLLESLFASARSALRQSSVNKERLAAGKSPVTDIWLWGQGKSLSLPTMAQKFGITGSVISAVDLVRGLGVLAGLQVRIVEGATGYLGTNYAGKVAAATQALDEQDFVYLHIEAPDETGHEGDLNKKIQAIEEFDRFVVGEMLKYQDTCGDLRIIVTPDHPTPVSIKTHSREPVPFTLCGPQVASGKFTRYSESEAHDLVPIDGPELFSRFIKKQW